MQYALGNFWTRHLSILASMVVISACVFSEETPYQRSMQDAPRSAPVLNPIFAIPVDAPPIHLADPPAEETKAYQAFSLTTPSVAPNGQPGDQVTGVYYQSRLPGPKPLIIVMPIWGSFTYPSSATASGLVSHGEGRWHVLEVFGEKNLIDWARLGEAPSEHAFMALMEEMTERIRATIVDFRRLFAWAATRPEIEPERLALIGFSHSAIHTALLATQEPLIDASVYVIGGVHPHRIIAHCPGRWTGDVQNAVANRFGWSNEDYEARIAPLYRPLDAAEYPFPGDPARVLVINATYDECIPEDSAEALWTMLGRPNRIAVHDTHQSAFLAMTPLAGSWLRKRIYTFFDRTLFAERSPSTPPTRTSTDMSLGSD
jgi:dienelactone hydrolase